MLHFPVLSMNRLNQTESTVFGLYVLCIFVESLSSDYLPEPQFLFKKVKDVCCFVRRSRRFTIHLNILQ